MSILRERLPDDVVLADRLRVAQAGAVAERRRRRALRVRSSQLDVEHLAADQVSVLDGLAAAGDHAGRHREARDRDAELRRRHVQQRLLGKRSSGADVRRAARDARATAAAARDVQPRLGVRVDHLREVHVQLFRREHEDARRRAVTELGLAVGDDARVLRRDRDPRVDLGQIRQVVVRGALVERREAVRRRRLPGGGSRSDGHDQRAAALDERLARELLLVKEARHVYAPPFAITAAAFWIAVRILGYVPQRHRCPFIAVRIWSSDGFFVVARRSAAWIIIPFWQ